MSRTFDMSNLIDAMENKDSSSRKESLEDDDNDDDIDDEVDDDDAVYGPYASFDQSASECTFLEDQRKTTQLIVKQASGKVITRLKRPRDLYALSNQFSAQMAQRWPAEVHIIAKRPNHICYVPSKPEALYTPAQNIDTKSLPRTPHSLGKVVYENSPDPNIKYFTRSKCSKKSAHAKPYYQLKDPDDFTLLFESRFESGNLMRAIKIGEHDYQLWLRFDMYTSKHTQWYYFMVRNAKPEIQYRFTIMNFIKPGSLYNDGMRPLMYSEINAENKGIGWVRTGTKIKYYRNDIRFLYNGKERFYYSLTWTCSFPNKNDTYYFAHCYPYTYSNLQDYLGMLASDPVRSKFFKQRVLCRTLAGNYVYVLTITAPAKKRNEAEAKKAIVITARVHPGETNSSWMMKGFLDFLTSNSQDAKLLRENFLFKVVPMLNPDGVIAGNYRCSLAGRDLNRNYKTVLKDSFPPIWHTRAMVKKLQEEREILMYCDLHGHSRKKNIFIYGCESKHEKKKRFWGRVFPAMLAKNSPDKEGTGRIFMWNFGIPNSFTMEASFCGSSLGNRKGYHFTIADYESMAHEFCDTLLDFYDPDRSKFFVVLSEIVGMIKKAIVERLKTSDVDLNADDINIEDKLDLLSDIESDSGGSDSSVSDGLPMQLLHASVPELSRKRRLKTRKERNRRISKGLNSKETGNSRKQSAGASQSQSTSAKSGRKRSDESLKNSSAKARLSLSQRGSLSTTNTVPHFVRDRAIEKSRLRKEYFDVLAAAFVNNENFDSADFQDVPHCRYTAGISSQYQDSTPHRLCERCYQSCSEGSDEDTKQPVSRRKPADQYPDVYWQQCSSEKNANTALDLAQRITVYNHRLNEGVPRKSSGECQAQQQEKPAVQQRIDKQYEDLSLGLSYSKLCNDVAGTSRSSRRRSKAQRQFQLNQEQRAVTSGLPTQQRLSNHFELIRTKSTALTGLGLQDRLRTGPKNDTSGFVSEFVSNPTIRRLPQLRRSADAVSQLDEKPIVALEAESCSDQLQQPSAQRCPNETKVGKVTGKAMKNSNFSRTEQRHDEKIPSEIDKNEVSMLREKMLQCGASGLVTYVLSVPFSQSSVDSQGWPMVTSTQRSQLHDAKSLDTLVADSSLYISNGINSPSLNRELNGKFGGGLAVDGSSSNLGDAVESTRKTTEGMESNFQQHSERSPNYEDALVKLEKSYTEDLLKEGLVTLNVNLDIPPVSSSNILKKSSARVEEKKHVPLKDSNRLEWFVEQNEDEVDAQAKEQELSWVVQNPSKIGKRTRKAKSHLLRLSGKEVPSSSSSFWGNGRRTTPPHHRGRTSKDLGH